MTMALFRPEAIEAQRAKIWGSARVVLPLPVTAMTFFCVVCVGALVGFALTATTVRREHVPGFLAARNGTATVTPARPGTISAVKVQEGQYVHRGDPLVVVNVEQVSETGSGVGAGVIDTLQRQRRSLTDQIALEQRRLIADTARLDAELRALQGDLDSLDAQRKLQAQHTAIVRDQLSVGDQLAKKGVTTQNDLKTRQDNLLAAQQAEIAAALRLSEKQHELVLKRAEREQLPLGAEQRIAQLKSAMEDIAIRIQNADVERAYLVTAPKDGWVTGLQAWTGQRAEAGLALLTIVPSDGDLVAELMVPPSAIGFVTPGQKVRLTYAGFSPQKFGYAEGQVETVTHVLRRPDQLAGPIAPAAPAYRVSVSLKRQSITAYGRELPLHADTPLEADIVLERRPLIDWILDPLKAAWHKPA